LLVITNFPGRFLGLTDIDDSAPDVHNLNFELDDVDNFYDINMCLGDNELHEFEDVQNVDDDDICDDQLVPESVGKMQTADLTCGLTKG